MSFRTLLVPLFGADRDRPALDAAMAVAREFDSHVDAMFVRPDPREVVPMMADGMSGAVIDDLMRAAEKHAIGRRDHARASFEASRSAAGIVMSATAPEDEMPTARWIEMKGRMDDVGIAEARLSDLTVFSTHGPDEGGEGLTAIESALLGSGRPILLVGEKVPEEIGRVVAVAWNGRTECARAVAFAMPFLRTAEKVIVLTAETPATKPEAGGRLVDFLAWHRIEAQLENPRPSGEPVGRVLADKAVALGCDLLVMGGYGHGRMREMILGGVTRQIVAKPRLPVFMAH